MSDGAVTSATTATEPPLTLRLASGIVIAQAIAEAAAIAWRSELRVPLRVMLILIVLSQIFFARRLLRFSPGAVFALFSFEIGTIVAALASRSALEMRLLLGLASVAAIALIAASLRAFPEMDLPMNRGVR